MIEVRLKVRVGANALDKLKSWRNTEFEQKVWLREQVSDADYELLTETRSVSSELQFSWIMYIRFKNANDALAFKLRFGL